MSAPDASEHIFLPSSFHPSVCHPTIWHGPITMIQSVLLYYTTNNMSVEGPYLSHTYPDHQSGRSNVGSREAQNVSEVAAGTYQQYTQPRRGPTTFPQGTIMPASTSSQSLLASLPSFMSVFGNGPDRLGVSEVNGAGAQSPSRTHFKRPQNCISPLPRRDSVSTFESTESSPTTTISTIESSLTEPSPQSPPESPDSSLPLTSFKNLRTNSMPGWGIMGDQDRRDHYSNSSSIIPGLERADSPNKKMRNMKNLSVNTSASNRHAPTLPKLGLSNQSGASHAFSAPPTPAFIVPPKVPRKKPSTLGLTISTPEAVPCGQTAQEKLSAVPQNFPDQQIRSFRMLQTSTGGPLFSPTIAPEGGMRLPPFSQQASSGKFGQIRPPLSVSPRASCDDTTCSPLTRQTLDHVQEEADYDLPLSQEAKSPAYPQGPVCIYDPLVYLYLEPSHVEAREFDVVLNVAREVKNPFEVATGQAAGSQLETPEAHVAAGAGNGGLAGRDSISVLQTALFEQPVESTIDALAQDAKSTPPGTPKATKPEPEYIHIPWDHNTNVVDDLLRLCELIDNRVRQEKRVLIHCQCGVSRSASLVVAYGLFKNSQLTVQEAYDAVKNRSRWIGPNMNLIYQLSEFKSKLPKAHAFGTSAWHSWRNNLGSGRPDPVSILSPISRSGLGSSSIRTTPQTSFSVPSQLPHEPTIPRASSFNPPRSAQLIQTSSAGEISPGPATAPADIHFAPDGLIAYDTNGLLDMATDLSSPPEPMEVDTDLTLPSSLVGNEAIEQKEPAPAGGVAKDLQEVAKDLVVTEPQSGPRSPPINMEFDTERLLSPNVASPVTMDIDIDDPVSPTTIVLPTPREEEALKRSLPAPSPTLPAGFSSLLSRRQGPLPLRQFPFQKTLPQLVSPQLPQRALDPDVPSTPSLLSPRAAEFTASPFHRTLAGDLAGSSHFEQGLMSPTGEDPRSPAHKGEAPITRSIFDMI